MSVVRRTLLVKDVKVFLRDVTQWSQLLLLLALVAMYLYNFRVLDLDRVPYMAGFIKKVSSFANSSLWQFPIENFGTARFHSLQMIGQHAQQLAAYSVSEASSFFSAAAAAAGTGPVAQPADAGFLNLSVITPANAMLGTSLMLQGTVQTAPAVGGHGAAINISAPNLEVSSDGSVSNTGYLGISSTVLQGWNAGEITLGGSASADANSASVGADHVIVV